MPLVTANQYQLMPDTLGAINQGFNLGQNIQQGVLRKNMQDEERGKQKDLKKLRQKALGLNGDNEIDTGVESIIKSPSIAKEDQALMGMGLDTTEKKQSAKSFSEKIANTSDEGLISVVHERIGEIGSQGGGDPRDTMELLKMNPKQIRGTADLVGMIVDRDAIRQMYAIDPKAAGSFLNSIEPKRRAKITGQKQTPRQQDYNQFASMPESTNAEKAKKNQFGRMIGAISKTLTVQDKIDIQKGVGDIKVEQDIAKEEGKLAVQTKLAPNLEKQKKLAKDAAGLSTEMFSRLGSVEKNISNLEEGIRLIDEGAAVGPIDKWFPSFKAASVEMENLRNRLGMDVIGQVTFGALSAGELKLAMDTAIPPNLKPEELRAWFERRIEPQKKLLSALEDAGIFLAEEGATIPKLMAKRRSKRKNQQDASTMSDDELFQ